MGSEGLMDLFIQYHFQLGPCFEHSI